MKASSPPRIFYYCYDHTRPAGGEKHSYQHVDVLNRNGYTAYAFHRTPNFRLQWFENDTAVVDGEGFARLYDPSQDYIVFPEDLSAETLRYPAPAVTSPCGPCHLDKMSSVGAPPARHG